MASVDTALKLVGENFANRQSEGELPKFLGCAGLIALMFNKIVNYHKAVDASEANRILLDIATDAVAALSASLPDDFVQDDESWSNCADEFDAPTFGEVLADQEHEKLEALDQQSTEQETDEDE